MTAHFIMWAQALDNSSPDRIDMHGEQLLPNETLRRQEAVSLVSTVVKAGNRVFEERGVRLTADARNFVVEVPSAQVDRAGRTAPIVCYGEHNGSADDTLADTVVAAVDDFAKLIGRSLRSEDSESLRRSFLALKKNYRQEWRLRAALVGALLLVVFCVMWWMASRQGPAG